MKTLFLDRDGVINPLVEVEDRRISPQDIGQFRFYPKVKRALEASKENGYRIIVFTNQPDVGKDWRFLDRAKLNEMNFLLKENNVDEVYACTHGPIGNSSNYHYGEDEITVCNCRKPQPGLIEKAAEDFDITFSESFVVGDNVSDLEAAKNYEQKHGANFRGKFIIGKETGLANRTFDNLYSTINYITGEGS